MPSLNQSVCCLKNVQLIISSCWLCVAAGDITVGHFMCQLLSDFYFPLSTLYFSSSPSSAAHSPKHLSPPVFLTFCAIFGASLFLFSFFVSFLFYSIIPSLLLFLLPCFIKPFSYFIPQSRFSTSALFSPFPAHCLLTILSFSPSSSTSSYFSRLLSVIHQLYKEAPAHHKCKLQFTQNIIVNFLPSPTVMCCLMDLTLQLLQSKNIEFSGHRKIFIFGNRFPSLLYNKTLQRLILVFKKNLPKVCN